MKKITIKQRRLDVLTGIKHRKQGIREVVSSSKACWINRIDYRPVNDFIDREIKNGLRHQKLKNRKNGIIIHLPEVMDFDKNYDVTVQHLNAIIELVTLFRRNKGRLLPRGAYHLASVNFDHLKSISTPAALCLTAEISNWEDSIRNKLKPQIKCWNDDIYGQLHDLGFFDLFENKPQKPPCKVGKVSDKRLVRYIKGLCGDEGKTKQLKDGISAIVGDKIQKWTFLHSGLDEAITNVSHHAYPETEFQRSMMKNWFLTGSYSERTKELKVAFYDQGVGIPKKLPTSKVKEKVFEYLSSFEAGERRKDEVLLKAAVEVGRTRTGRADRGKGLHDLLEFIKKRESGRLSILSGRGHYKFTLENGEERSTTSRSKLPIQGTLLIWSVIL
ncbi:hypothetical protein [Photobacterium sp. OFAV2-7]|uniref:hypothetical protein n=1 Tax=Photobacterium sp. OFAV2-7 TaxID=2917748 RepID=UPI001EF6DA01|nr:hypothetical protein [Photobacterium sp. OFAV2-7]MCG7586491.1 hypothetical protein [Photobacterium sp. OFAV2-7]